MTLTVYGTAGRSFRVHWLLAELGQDYETVSAFPHSPEIHAVNPLGQVPALRDGDHILTDSLAILNYLADRAGRFTYPTGTPERALMEARINFVLTEMEAPIWLMARHGFVLPKDQRHPGLRAVTEPDFARAVKKFETLIGDAEFFAGADFTIADIIAGHTADWAIGAKIPVNSAVLEDYLARLQQRPAWAKAKG